MRRGGRLGDEDNVVLFGHRDGRQGDAGADIADQDVGALGLDQFAGLLYAGVGVAAVVLLDDNDGPPGDFHRAARGVLQAQIEAIGLARAVDGQRAGLVGHQANHQVFPGERHVGHFFGRLRGRLLSHFLGGFGRGLLGHFLSRFGRRFLGRRDCLGRFRDHDFGRGFDGFGRRCSAAGAQAESQDDQQRQEH